MALVQLRCWNSHRFYAALSQQMVSFVVRVAGIFMLRPIDLDDEGRPKGG